MYDTLLAQFTSSPRTSLHGILHLFQQRAKFPTYAATLTSLQDKLRPWSQGWCSGTRGQRGGFLSFVVPFCIALTVLRLFVVATLVLPRHVTSETFSYCMGVGVITEVPSFRSTVSTKAGCLCSSSYRMLHFRVQVACPSSMDWR